MDDFQKYRALCLRCLRPEVTCYCAEVRPIQTRFQLILLQHPLEHRNNIGTARMTHHCLVNSKLIVGTSFDDDAQVNELIADPDQDCVVLYPGRNSTNLSLQSRAEVESRFPAERKTVVFVIDGTWFCAKKMVRRSRNLSQLPQICFTPKVGSEYRIRRQPEFQCLSTLEAVHHLVQLLTPEVNADNLLDVFRSMVGRQLRFRNQKEVQKKIQRKIDGKIEGKMAL